MNQRHALSNLILSAPTIIGAAMVFLFFTKANYPLPFLASSLGVFSIGFALFLKAKLSLISKGHLVTFGPVSMSPWNGRLYKIGYALMSVGMVLALFGLY